MHQNTHTICRWYILYGLGHLLADGIQRFGSRQHVNIDDPPQLIVVDLGWRIDLLRKHNRAEGRVALAVLAAKRDIPELLHIHVANLPIGILNGEHVIVAGLRINPIARRDNAVRGKSRDYVVDDILGRQSNQAGSLAVDVHFKPWVLQILRNEDCRNTARCAKLGRQALRLRIRCLLIVRRDLNVDWRG